MNIIIMCVLDLKLSFYLSQGVVDLYINNQVGNSCKSFEQYCPLVELFKIPNKCCIRANAHLKEPCGPDTTCFAFTDNYLSWDKPGILRMIVFMILQFIVQFGFVLLIETGALTQLKYAIFDSGEKLSLSNEQSVIEEEYGDIIKDSDVTNEEIRISKGKLNQEIFVVDRLTKYYARFMAVKGISFSLDASECFGLLGTSLFSKKKLLVFAEIDA